MVPGRFDIYYYTGASFTVDFTILRPLESGLPTSLASAQKLTGMTVIFSMKRYKKSAEVEVLRFTQADSQLTVNDAIPQSANKGQPATRTLP